MIDQQKENESESKITNIFRPYKDTISGTAAGIASILVGHPFDTIKVRLQVPLTASDHTQRFTGVLDCLKKTIAREGMGGVYKGLLPPLCLEAVTNSVLFTAYGLCQRYFYQLPDLGQMSVAQQLRVMAPWPFRTPATSKDVVDTQSTQPSLNTARSPHKLTFFQTFLAGGFAGACACLIITPTELIKTRIQITQHVHLTPWATARSIVQVKGPLGLFHGFRATALRDIYSFGLYFATYESFKDIAKTQLGSESSFGPALAGGFAGVVAWISSYPFDVIKSRMQTDDLAKPQYPSLAKCVRAVWAEGGLRLFFAGMTTTVLRAFPVNVALLATYEFVQGLL